MPRGVVWLTAGVSWSDVDEVADGFGQPAAGIAQQFTMLKAPDSVDAEVQRMRTLVYTRPSLPHASRTAR